MWYYITNAKTESVERRSDEVKAYSNGYTVMYGSELCALKIGDFRSVKSSKIRFTRSVKSSAILKRIRTDDVRRN